jgi:hypothetical protein
MVFEHYMEKKYFPGSMCISNVQNAIEKQSQLTQMV